MDKIGAYEELITAARSAGAQAAVLIRTEEVVLDVRANFKCLVPMCPSYGQNKTCPPIVARPDEFRKVLDSYTFALFVQKTFHLAENEVGSGALSEVYLSPSLQALKRRQCLEFYGILEAIERKALELGFPYTAGLGEGPCRVCDPCTLNAPCPVPFKARPSMEAMGIDVLKTAANAGCPIHLHATPTDYTYNGLVLTD